MDTNGQQAPPPGNPGWQRAPGQRYYTPDQRRALVEAFQRWEGTREAFLSAHSVTPTTLYGLLRAYREGGSAGLATHVRGRQRIAKHKGQYTPEQRRQAVEAYLKRGGSAESFANVWGVTPRVLRYWILLYRTGGPKALEGRSGRKPGRAPVPAGVEAAIVETKAANPGFGLRKVRDFLARFRGIKASPPVIRRVVQEAALPAAPQPTRRWKKRPAPRFFERAKPNQLWQSDITSFMLPRHHQRVYLVVFLDDHSRYVVAWKAALRQTGEFVLEALLEGIQRWGKPQEVLTDQGRQYFSWRGKSEFQKLLDKHGIAHVVSRAHHPETLGKCERLWATIGSELMSRVQPVDLSDFQARLGHFFAHYNHFRPHQGIAGVVPADRYFGAETAVRAALEAQIGKQALGLAVGEVPRPHAYLVGQIGDQAVSMHGEGGKLVVQLPDGRRTELAYDALGAVAQPPEAGEGNDGRGKDGQRDGSGTAGNAGEAGGERGAEAGTAEAGVRDANGGVAGEGIVGSGERGRADCGAPDGDVAVRALAGEDQPEGTGGEDRPASGAGVAVEPAGPRGFGGGAAQATAAAAEGHSAAAETPAGRGSASVAESLAGSGAEERDPGRSGAGIEGVSGAADGAAGAGGSSGREAEAGEAEGEKKPAGPGEGWEGGSGRTGDGSGELTGAGSPASLG